jgi:hypothetical protein
LLQVAWDATDPSTYIRYNLNAWYRVVMETRGSAWRITVYTDAGTQVGQLTGTLPAKHKPFTYLIIMNPEVGDWPTGDGPLDNLIVGGTQRVYLPIILR